MFMKKLARSRGALAASSAVLAAALALTGLAPASAAGGEGATSAPSTSADREAQLKLAFTAKKSPAKANARASAYGDFWVRSKSPSWSISAGYDSLYDDDANPDWEVGDSLTALPSGSWSSGWSYAWFYASGAFVETGIDDDSLTMVKFDSPSFTVPDNAAGLGLVVGAFDEYGEVMDIEARDYIYSATVRSKMSVKASGAFVAGRTAKFAPVVGSGSAEPSRKAGFCEDRKTWPWVQFTAGVKSVTFAGADFGKTRTLKPCQEPKLVQSALPGLWKDPRVVARYYQEGKYTSPKIARGTLPSGTVRILYGKSVNPKSTKVGQKLVAQSTAKTVAGQRNAYQWLRDGKAIKGASKSSYTPGAADYKHKVSVRITRSAAGYGTVAKTTGQVSITIGASKAGKASVSGTAKKGKTVRAKLSGWASGSKYSYQWYRNGKAIKGATKSSYKLASADRRKTVKLKVTAKKAAWTTVSTVTRAVRVR